MINSYFDAGDWVVIAIYLLGIIGLGLWFGKDQRNTAKARLRPGLERKRPRLHP